MKRLLSAALALSLLGGSAAVAAPYDQGGQSNDRGYSSQGNNGSYDNQDRGDNYRGHPHNDGGAIVAGVGILTLAAVLASQHRHHFHEGWYNRDGGGYGHGYNRGYGDHRGGHGDNGRR